MAETGQGAIVPASEVPNPQAEGSERATAILAWVLEHGIRVRQLEQGVYRAYVIGNNRVVQYRGTPAYGPVAAAAKAYDEWRNGVRS